MQIDKIHEREIDEECVVEVVRNVGLEELDRLSRLVEKYTSFSFIVVPIFKIILTKMNINKE